MMMMIAPNFLAQREKEEEAGERRKVVQAGTSTPGADSTTGPSRSGVLDARNRIMREGLHLCEHNSMVWVYFCL